MFYSCQRLYTNMCGQSRGADHSTSERVENCFTHPQPLTLVGRDLGSLLGNDFRNPSVVSNPSRNADTMAAIRGLWISKFRTVTSPDNHREDLIGICSVKIQKGRLAATIVSEPRAHNFAANSLLFADVALCFFGGNRLLRYRQRNGKRKRQEDQGRAPQHAASCHVTQVFRLGTRALSVVLFPAVKSAQCVFSPSVFIAARKSDRLAKRTPRSNQSSVSRR